MTPLAFTTIRKKNAQEVMNKLIAFINEGNTQYIDNHDNTTKTLEGYIIFDDEHVCPIFKTQMQFGLGPLYLDDETQKIHLSRLSAGGVINLHRHNYDVGKAIEHYNAKAREYQYATFRLINDFKIL